MTKQLGVAIISFQRYTPEAPEGDRVGPWEEGVALLESPGTSNVLGILDSKGNFVGGANTWDYRREEYKGAFTWVQHND